jgi:transposase
MQGHKTYQPKMLYQVQLHELVSQDNFYRKLLKFVDFHFLYKETAKYYGTEGQESIDPVVFFKICMVGYLNNITSDRKLIEYCSNCLDVRLFLQYDIDESLPWHSTISRTRQLYSEEVFMRLFKQILSKCIQAGLVRGKRQAIDSAYVKANASMDSIVEKEILDDADVYMEELNESSEYKIQPKSICPEDKSKPYITPQKHKEVNKHHEWKNFMLSITFSGSSTKVHICKCRSSIKFSLTHFSSICRNGS